MVDLFSDIRPLQLIVLFDVLPLHIHSFYLAQILQEDSHSMVLTTTGGANEDLVSTSSLACIEESIPRKHHSSFGTFTISYAFIVSNSCNELIPRNHFDPG